MKTLTEKLNALAEAYEYKITLANAHQQLQLLANDAAQLALSEIEKRREMEPV